MTQNDDYIKRLCALIDGSVVGEWTAHHEYPGYVALTNPQLPTMTILMTPDHSGPDRIDWYVDEEGHSFDNDGDLSGEIAAAWTGDLTADLALWLMHANAATRQATPILSRMVSNRRVEKFRRDCVECLVGNTADNVYDTGNSTSGVSIAETAAYYLVRASYCDGDIADVIDELADTADLLAPDFIFGDSTDEASEVVERAGQWDDDDIKTDVVAQLRSMTLPAKARDVLLRCCDVIEGLFDDACPHPEMSDLLDDITAVLKGGE